MHKTEKKQHGCYKMALRQAIFPTNETLNLK